VPLASDKRKEALNMLKILKEEQEHAKIETDEEPQKQNGKKRPGDEDDDDEGRKKTRRGSRKAKVKPDDDKAKPIVIDPKKIQSSAFA
jgi:hypothetical protein